MGRVLPNEPERVWGFAWAPEETKASLEEARTFLERARRSRENRRLICLSLSLQRPATSDCWDAMATGYLETFHSLNSADEHAFSAILFA